MTSVLISRTNQLLLLSCLAVIVCPAVAQRNEERSKISTTQLQNQLIKFTDYRLTNGLRVLLAPDETASGIAVNLSFDTGSRNENLQQAGLANLLQNIFLRSLRQTLNERGSKGLQGVTNQERTSFFSELAVEELAALLSALSQEWQTPNLALENIEGQRREILKQCEQARETPFGNVQPTLLELSYRKFAYQHSTTCSLSQHSLNKLAIDAFFKKYYAPNNAVLVLAGRFNENSVRQIVAKKFGPIPRQPVAPQVDALDQRRFLHERRKILHHANAEPPLYMSAYLTVPSDYRDWFALNLLGDILGQGNNARLFKALVATKLATSVPEGASELRGQSLFQVGARVSPKVDVERVEAIIDAEIARIQKQGVTAAEIATAKSQEQAYSEEQLRTPLGKANFLARAAIYYRDPNRINTELGRMFAVSAKDVQRVAQKYLIRRNRAVVIVRA